MVSSDEETCLAVILIDFAITKDKNVNSQAFLK